MSLHRLDAALYPKPRDAVFKYGTAGFRMSAELLPSVVFRVGMVATLRSLSSDNQVVGVMITASHNPVKDNGVKMVDSDGSMLDPTWEALVTAVVNSSDAGLHAELETIVSSNGLNGKQGGRVVVGRDSRPSGSSLVAVLIRGIKAVGGIVTDLGVVTTPQLHYVTHFTNYPEPGSPPNEAGYLQKLSDTFKMLKGESESMGPLYFDGANGVGANKAALLGELVASHLQIKICNDGTQGTLNDGCGADFVKSNQTAPEGVPVIAENRYAACDGDADRLVYFFFDGTEAFHLLDGDRISCLFVGFISKRIEILGLKDELDICVVQTAYANGSSTRYIKETLKEKVAFTKTGVKHLHHRAIQVGVYVRFAQLLLFSEPL